jgi:hypothetical protein
LIPRDTVDLVTLLASTAPTEVKPRAVTFENSEAMLHGTLYLPQGCEGAQLAAVVLTGTWILCSGADADSLGDIDLAEAGCSQLTRCHSGRLQSHIEMATGRSSFWSL